MMESKLIAGSVGDDPEFGELFLQAVNSGNLTNLVAHIDSLRAPRSAENSDCVTLESALEAIEHVNQSNSSGREKDARKMLTPATSSASVQGAEISRDVAYQALSALGHAMTICDGVPTKADLLAEDSALKYLGLMVNYQAGTGHHGYRMIQDAIAALGKELSRTEAAPSTPAVQPLAAIAEQTEKLTDDQIDSLFHPPKAALKREDWDATTHKPKEVRASASPAEPALRDDLEAINKAGDAFIGSPVDVTSDCLKAIIAKIGIGNTERVTMNGVPVYEIEVRAIAVAETPKEGA